MAIYVLVHGAWHTGAALEPVADLIRAEGIRFTRRRGNRPGDPKTTGLAEAIESIIEYLEQAKVEDVILVGHSYGGMVITGVADRLLHRIRRLVYLAAFVPNGGKSAVDMALPHQVAAMEALAAERNDGSVLLPFAARRESFINDADLETAQRTYEVDPEFGTGS